MSTPLVTLAIAGTDSGGAAGLAADLATFAALGTHGACVVTAVTAQDTTGVQDVHPVPLATIAASAGQLQATAPRARSQHLWGVGDAGDEVAGEDEGRADGCRALGLPVTGGNVSLYNQTGDVPINPTPVIGVLGVHEDVRRRVPSGWRGDGETVLLLGQTRPEFSATGTQGTFSAS